MLATVGDEAVTLNDIEKGWRWMIFKSVNEVDKFAFDDCEVISLENKGGKLIAELEALIVLESNSQNDNCTKSYAGTAYMEIENASIEECIKVGFKRYDANNVLLEQEDDKVLEQNGMEEITDLIKTSATAYLYSVHEEKLQDSMKLYSLEFEIPCDEVAPKMYEIRIKGCNIMFTWDRYMNQCR